MTAKEKRILVSKYCLRHACGDCNLYNKWIREDGEGCITISNATEEELDLALYLIGKDDTDTVNHPPHYETGKFECIDVMMETQGEFATECFCICNAFKYLYRHNRKNGTEDIKKAIWYLQKFVELKEGKRDA